MLVIKVGDWVKTTRILENASERYKKACDQAVLKEANYIRGKIVANLTSGGALAGQPFRPLSPSTMIVRSFLGFGGSKPLIVTGGLLGAVAVSKIGNATFVGIRRTGGGKGGANLAELHEYGGGPWTHQMTDKQRRFLQAAFGNSGAASPGKGNGTITIRIPARPFVGPVIDRFAKPEDVRKRFFANVALSMGGDFGK